MKSRDKCHCSPVLTRPTVHTVTAANFLKIGQFVILQPLQPPPAGQMFLQLYVSTDKHINQSILTGRHEESAP